jgi:hypothetical protein
MNVNSKGSTLAVAAVTMSKPRSRPLFLDDGAKDSPLPVRHSAVLRIASHSAPDLVDAKTSVLARSWEFGMS